MKVLDLALMVLVVSVSTSHCDPFKNLDFDNPNTSGVRDGWTDPGTGYFIHVGSGTTEELLPGWNLKINGEPAARLNINLPTAGRDPAILWHNRAISLPFSFGYSLKLTAYRPSGSMGISQIGDVPFGLNAMVVSLLGFRNLENVSPVTLSMNGEALSLVREYDTNYFVFDVSKFAGKTVELDVTVHAYNRFTPGFSDRDSVYIDSIAFIVPEPSAGLLLFSGGLVMLAARRLLTRRK